MVSTIRSGFIPAAVLLEQDGDFTFSTREANTTFSGSGTIIIEATANGGFKFIPLEAKGTIRTPKGDAQDVRGGDFWFLENQLALEMPSTLI